MPRLPGQWESDVQHRILCQCQILEPLQRENSAASGVVIAALAIDRVSIVQWFKFMAPLLLALAIIAMEAPGIAAL